MPNVVVFDVGGTKMATTIINEHGKDLLEGNPRRVETKDQVPAEEFVGLMAAELDALDSQFGDVVAWGAAFPGPYRRLSNFELEVFPRNIPGVRGRSIEAEMRPFFPEFPE